ncbi:cobalt chelatase [Rhizobium sp. N122]|uniref:cobaltochelatase subunit CobN n=1 Tax=Rhizobium sp. N122 TaxID=1764272 RepID=UPI000B5A5017|nr:cobaltochelatase subunit CobN [Rhizobium sp. N122]OWV83705.1 cobalt chelatase [Rhizobium sp. N122]
MHLLLAQQGTISDGEEPIDLGQTPGDILFLSAADSELAAIAAAHRACGGPHSLRLASLMSLKHPMSVDTYVERTARHAKLIVVRALGGASYFRYALEALHAAASRSGARIAVLPGDARPDAGLAPFSNIASDDLDALWAYLVEGGDANARAFLDYAAAMLSGAEKPAPAVPLMKAGIWWPGRGLIGVEELRRVTHSTAVGPIVAISFYRALVQSGETGPIEALIEALQAHGLRPLPVFAYSLKDSVSTGILESVFSALKPDVVINTTGFAVSAPGADRQPTVLEATGAVVLQAILSASSREAWAASSQGLSARDLGMNVALPEVDGRVLARAVSFKTAARYDAAVETNIVASEPDAGRVRYTAELAANWARLRATPAHDRRIALVMANYPNRDGRLGNGVGLDTPAGSIQVLRAMEAAGYPLSDIPADGDTLIRHLMEGPTNSGHDGRVIRETLSLSLYNSFLASLPNQIQDEVRARWGDPGNDPYFRDGAFVLPFARFGGVLVGIQPARGYNIDPKESYHSPDLVPPHGYLAFYAFLRGKFGAHAVIHMGKHGNLEWLPGKALALSETCYPEAILGPLPHLYPFIVNDPGEGTQAKRRAAAVIIDHLTPPLTRAESYGPLKDLEALVDEYYEASGGDPRRIRLLSRQILDLVTDIGLDRDAGITSGESEGEALKKLDAYLCDLKEMQIRDGLHVFGVSPEGRLLTDLTVALARVPRGLGEGGDASLQRAIAGDVLKNPSPTPPHKGEGLTTALAATLATKADDETVRPASPSHLWGGVGEGPSFDPLNCDMAALWTGPRPAILAGLLDAPWRTNGDTVERIELLAAKFVAGEMECPTLWSQTRLVLSEIETRLKPSILACGPAEISGLLSGLDGRFVAPGPSGAPTRGRPDVLPTGRNFYSVDSRAVPTPAAYELGKKSAELLIRRYVQDHGDWPVSFGLTAWGTSNMRTGGDDIAQALALIGVKPLWDVSSRRVTGYEIIPQAVLGRPRVDVTLRISGFFRDAFPEQIALFDKAIRAVGALEEDEADNPIAARMRGEAARLAAAGLDATSAKRRAGYRVFGSKPGAYGAGLQALIDEKGWERRADLAEAYLVWGSYAYGAGEEGKAERGLFEERLRSVQAVVQNQDNREHDLLDSDDYYQFEGGMAAAAEQLTGARPSIYHNDHSRPEKPVIRSLEEEIGRVVRGRVVNPKWISGVMRHGYKGAAEIAATVDYLFAFAATTGAVGAHHFEAVYQAFVTDPAVRDFMVEKNPAAFDEMTARLSEAIDRSLWTPRSNSARFDLAKQQNEVNR